MKTLMAPRATKSIGVPSISEDGTFITAPIDWLPWFRSSSTGLVTTEEGSLALPTIYACVRVLSEDVASLPLILYRRLAGGGKERATDHPLYDVFHDAPNPEMTSFTWRETLMTHVLTWGNSPQEKVYDNLGRLELWPIRPSRIDYRWVGGRKVYWDVQKDQKLKDDSIFHVMGQSLNGLSGLSPIALHRETLGEQAATRDFGKNFYRNNARPATVLTHPKLLSKDAQARLKEQMDELKGTRNSGKTVLLEEGLDFKEIGIPPEDAQYIETRKFQREEAAQLFRMPPHKVGILDHATFSNIEHQAIDYVTGTLRPWLVRIEQSIKRQLLADEPDLYVEFLVDGLLRGDAKSRAEALAIRWQHATLTADEWRDLENENRLPDGTGSRTYYPTNYKPVPLPGEEPAEEEPMEEPDEFPALFSVKSYRQFDCPECGKLINRLAAPGTVGFCRGCKSEKTLGQAIEPPVEPRWTPDGESSAVIRFPAPVVNVEVEKADAPIVHVHTDSFVEAIEDLKIMMSTPRNKRIERDADGRIVGLVET